MITGLGIHLRPMVRNCKSLHFGHISRIFKKKTAAVPPLPPKIAICRQNFFLPFLAELDNSESFETNFFFPKKIPLDLAFDTFLKTF